MTTNLKFQIHGLVAVSGNNKFERKVDRRRCERHYINQSYQKPHYMNGILATNLPINNDQI